MNFTEAYTLYRSRERWKMLLQIADLKTVNTSYITYMHDQAQYAIRSHLSVVSF